MFLAPVRRNSQPHEHPFCHRQPGAGRQGRRLYHGPGLENLKGHRSVGGLRASIYNAMPKAGVQALVDCLKEFEAQNR